MAKENQSQSLRQELVQLKYDFNLLQKIDCSPIENERYARFIENGETLPSDIFRRLSTDGKESAEFYTIRETDLTEHEKEEYYSLKQLELLSSIKGLALIIAGTSAISAFLLLILFILSL